MDAGDSSSSSSSSSSSNAIAPISQKYEVFLSFRGKDTRYGFVSHLYTALCRKKIKTYIDDRSLERGHEISHSLMQAIQESKVSIIIFSKNYASSSWCLDELVHILHCKERYRQIVIPVFYRVEPTHIRKQQGKFSKAFFEIEERFKDSVEKVNNWRVALSTAVDLSGWDSNVIRSEAELVDRIVDDAMRKLDSISKQSDDWKGLIGIKKQTEEIELLLCMSIRDVRVIGIWGMGGIGKTTLARAVFNELSSQFEGSCFLENVREEWAKCGKLDLQKQLFSKLLEEDNPQHNINSRLSKKMLFLVLDDVNDQEQLEFLLGDFQNWFGYGSRIIVTTRDIQMLRYVGADAVYEVKGLNNDEAMELFLLSAFKGNVPPSGYITISERVVNYAKGVPLAIKVLGSYLRCKEKENWESELNELEQTSNEKIQNVLRVSYDGLHEQDQQIFLDIACCFKGKTRDWAEDIWNACGFLAKTRVDNLIEKSLVTIQDSNTLWMHDLVQEMGRETQLSSKELGKRSRLWNVQDIIYVLENNLGNEEIQGIFLGKFHIEKVELGPVVFEMMHNLRYIIVWDVMLHFPRGLNSLPSSLRYLEWHNYPLNSLPSNFVLRNLVELKMPGSKLERLWNGVQHLRNLKHIDLSLSVYLTQIPDLSRAPKLETVNLACCTSLVQIPPLNFRIFDKLTKADEPWSVDRNKRRKPGTLTFRRCISLRCLPKLSGNIKYLDLSGTAVEELPTSIPSLNNLILLDLSDCKFIKSLPSSIRQMESLKCLKLSNCVLFDKFPAELPRNIVELNMGNTMIEQVPASIKNVSSLEVFCLGKCQRLVNLPTSICELKSLRHLDLHECSKLENFPEILEPMGCLRTLDLSETGIRRLPVSFEKLIGLHNLLLNSCYFLHLNVTRITSLRKLSLVDCRLVGSLDWLGCLSSLEKLDLSKNLINRISSSIKNLSRLIEFRVRHCKNLQSLPELPLSLGLLDVSRCTSLETVSDSKTALVRGRWNEYQVTPYKEFLFSDCTKLNKTSQANIMIESHIRILRTATISASQSEEISRVFDEKPSVYTCYPGNQIPKWFIHQSKDPSITVELPPNWHNDFIGFALCVAVEFEKGYFKCLPYAFKCEVHFKTNHGGSRKFHSEFLGCWKKKPENIRKFLGNLYSNHVLMWYNYEDFHDYFDADEVSFTFDISCKIPVGSDFGTDKFGSCGVRLLYLQDAEEFGIVNKAKPNENATVDSDTYNQMVKDLDIQIDRNASDIRRLKDSLNLRRTKSKVD